MEAVMLSRVINPLMYGKIAEMYLEKQSTTNPIYTLLNLNEGSAEKIFSGSLEGLIYTEWPVHLAFLLRNIEFCNKTSFNEFIEILIGKLKGVGHMI